MRICSVDPGVTGAFALIDGGRLQQVIDMPVMDGECSGVAVGSLLADWKPDIVVIEQQQAMPKNGSIAGFKQGLNYGIVLGAAGALRVAVAKIRPPDWKKLNGLTGKDKEASRGLAIQLFPEYEPKLRRKMDHNRAEAILIGRAYAFKAIKGEV